MLIKTVFTYRIFDSIMNDYFWFLSVNTTELYILTLTDLDVTM